MGLRCELVKQAELEPEKKLAFVGLSSPSSAPLSLQDQVKQEAENMNDRGCEEKLALLFEYRNATSLYSNRVALMADIAAGLLPKREFAMLSKTATQAHEKCLKARERFYKHIEEHGC